VTSRTDIQGSLRTLLLVISKDPKIMKYLARKAVFLATALAMSLSATAEAAKRKAKDVLQYVPADTPYVIAVTKPLPNDLMDKFEPAIDRTLAAYQRIFRYEMSETLIEMSDDEDGAEEAMRLQDTMEEFLKLLSVQGLRDAGIGRGSLFAIYGDGILPVMRIALTDPGAFEDAILRMEEKAGEKLPVATLQGETYRYIDADDMHFVIAAFGKDAVVTMVPKGYSEDRLAETLGLRKPKNNLARSKQLRNIAKEYGYTDHFISFIDVEKLAATFLGDPGGRNTEFLQMLELDASEMTEVCRSELAGLAGIAPRIVMGYTEVNSDALRTGMVVELRDDLATGLATIPAAVPGLGPDLGSLFSFGFSMDPLALRQFYEARLDAMDADPYQCETLVGLQEGAAKGREALAQPLPPVVYSFRGMLANVTGIEGMDLVTQTPPESIDGSLLFAIENAQDLVTMAAMMSPEIAALNLIPDGKAKKLDLPQVAAVAQEAFAALSEAGLSVSLGEGAAQNAESMLQADVAESQPFVSMSMNARSYYDYIGRATMNEKEDEDGEEIPMAMRTAIRDIMVSSGDLYERMLINVHLTARGIEFDSRMTLGD
jgi:hypothetical protein